MFRSADFNVLVRICLLRSGPQDLRYSPSLLMALVVLSALLSFAVMSGLDDPGGNPASILLHTGLGLAMPYALLQIRRLGSRYVQTASAFFGTSLLLTMALLPALLASSGSSPTLWPAIWWLGIVIWSIAVLGHILTQSLDVSRGVALALAIGYFVISIWIGQVIG